VQPFLTSADNRIKANAARALYNMNAALALEKLHEMVKSQELFFRDSGTYILGNIGDEKCLELLIEVLLVESDSEILKKAINALSQKATCPPSLLAGSPLGLEGFRVRAIET
jgi:HEAT repeat protein